MYSRQFTALVVILWLTMMGWLVAKKILPSLIAGSPPTYDSTLPPKEKQNEPENWRVYWNGAPIGWSTSRVDRDPSGASSISSKLIVENLALSDVLPPGISTLFGALVKNLDRFDLDVTSHVILDAFGGLASFKTSARVAGLPQRIKVVGNVQGGRLKVSMQAGDYAQPIERTLPEGALVSNELSPYAYLHNLQIGQTWSTPVYSPFNPPNAPVEMVQASVDRRSTIAWNGKNVGALVVVFRDQSSLAATSEDGVVGQMWVRDDGLVLRQELTLLGKRLTFVRLAEGESPQVDLWNHSKDASTEPAAVVAE